LGSSFVAQYARRRDLALRAKSWEQLFDPLLPGIFLAWAKRTDTPELIEAVERRGVQVADWKAYTNEQSQHGKSEQEEHERQIADWKKLFDQAKSALCPLTGAFSRATTLYPVGPRTPNHDARYARKDRPKLQINRFTASLCLIKFVHTA
jgi:hypothetical protein